MGTQRVRRRKGGVAIASGSDGCVFDTQFDETGNAKPAPGIVSKVFPEGKRSVAENEFKSIELVKGVTGGKGVVISDGELLTIRAVKDTIPDTVGRRGEFSNACGQIADQKSGLFYVIESPRVKGSLIDTDSKNLSVTFFSDAITALQLLGSAGLCHMDIAPRNIFISNNHKALVGDFGNLLSISDPDLKTKLDYHLRKYNIRTVVHCLSGYGATAALQIAILAYMSPDFKDIQSEIKNLLEPYAGGGYRFMDFYHEAQELKDVAGTDLKTEMKAYLESILTMSAPEDIFATLKKEFVRSDLRCLSLVMRSYCTPSVEVTMTVSSLWTSGSMPDTTAMLMARLAAIRGRGRRKTRRKRQMRVKMSRRR
jgi:hypothetical protein